LARRDGATRQEEKHGAAHRDHAAGSENRLTNLKYATKIDRIDAALRALGKRLYVDAA
jgi:hypothetical protein